jgi:serine acetyltransferase
MLIKQKFLTSDMLQSIEATNTIYSPSSVLISENVSVGKNNIFYPNVVIECHDEGMVTIGDNNTFYPGTYILCANGKVVIGSNNEFGPSGLTIKANLSDAVITIGNEGRYSDGASIMGRSTLGSGSQILGNITVQNCSLGEGTSFTHPDPDLRGAVLKGMGLARNLTLTAGQVVNGLGDFSKAPVEQQSFYHPKKE